MSNDIVKFLMPDGTEVSNDPRFDLAEALQESLESTPNKGDAGITAAEFTAQTQTEHPADLNSGQPGVGENPVPDPLDLIPNTGTPAMARQKEDLYEAQGAGADITSTSVKDPKPVDSNEQVKEVREATEAEREAILKAQEKLGENDPGDPDVPKSEWTGPQLQFELAQRNAGREEENKISTQGVKKKAQLAALLDEDDARRAGNQPS